MMLMSLLHNGTYRMRLWLFCNQTKQRTCTAWRRTFWRNTKRNY